MRAHLTDVSVRALKTAALQYKVWDSSTRGFGVLVGKTKSWIVMQGPQRRLKVIGRVTDMSLSDARKAAKKLLANGLPAPSLSFSEAVELFLEDKGRGCRSRTVRDYKRLLGRLDISSLDIAPHDAARTLAFFKAQGEYNHILVAAKVFFNWCIKRNYIARNPFTGFSQYVSTSRSRVLSDDELAAIWKACDGTFGTIVKLLILTGQRRGEISSLHWEWVSEEARTISFPASVTKNGRLHTVPFGEMTHSVLNNFGSDRVIFLARGRDTAFNGWSKSKAALDMACGVTHWTLHDLRRTYASKMAAIGVAPHVIEKLLNHITGTISGVAAIYNRYQFMPEMRKAVEAYEAQLAGLFAAPQRTEAA